MIRELYSKEGKEVFLTEICSQLSEGAVVLVLEAIRRQTTLSSDVGGDLALLQQIQSFQKESVAKGLDICIRTKSP